MQNFTVTVWRDVRANWSHTFPGTADGYGAAYHRARYHVERLGGDVSRFDAVWPDAGSPHSTAVPVGRAPSVSLSVVYC